MTPANARTTAEWVPVRDGVRGGQGVLVLGTVQLGLPYGVANRTGQPGPEAAEGILSAAAGVGVTHLDTARAYGTAERCIGRAAPRGLRVVTKVAPLEPGEADAARAVRESVRCSRAELGAHGERLAGLLLHRMADARDAAWDVLRSHRDGGVADRIGVSVQNPAELLAALRLPDVGYVQLPFNLLDRRWLDPAVTDALAARPGLVVTVRSVFLQGLLTAGRDVTWPGVPDPDRDALVAAIDALVRDLGRTGRADLCTAYALSHPWVTSIVAGAETAAQVRDTAAAAARPPLTDAERGEVLARLPAGPADLVDPSRWRTG